MHTITDLKAAQRTDDRALFAPLREHRNAAPVWPLTASEAAAIHAAHDSSVEPWHHPHFARVDTAGMAPGECCTEMGADTDDANDRYAGAGAVVVPAVVAFALACAALVALLAGWL